MIEKNLPGNHEPQPTPEASGSSVVDLHDRSVGPEVSAGASVKDDSGDENSGQHQVLSWGQEKLKAFGTLPKTVKSAYVSITLIGLLTFWGAYKGRWITDDGLIVLRTVQNLLAGNGPVFNVGERVESNTSTLWQYLIYVVALFGVGDLAEIAIWLGIFFAVLALVIGSYGSYRYQVQRENENGFTSTQMGMPSQYISTVFLPFGALIYIALPPAREFFTSGLEWSLSLFYLATLWLLLLKWDRETGALPSDSDPSDFFRTLKTRHSSLPRITLFCAFWAGLSWLVRPDVAVYGALAGLVLLVRHRSVRNALIVVSVGAALPLAYQIFRMGFYGMIVPMPALAKEAAGTMGDRGLLYLKDFAEPHYVLIAVVAVGCLSVLMLRAKPALELPVVVLVGGGFLHLFYLVRVGGDFMHGRMMLLPLFAMLLPVMLVAVRSIPTAFVAGTGVVYAAIVAMIGMDQYEVWRGKQEEEMVATHEKGHWSATTGRSLDDPPTKIRHFDGLQEMQEFHDAVRQLEEGAAYTRFVPGQGWQVLPRGDENYPPVLYWLSLGFTGANAPLDVRVLDYLGLATPLVARTERPEDTNSIDSKNLPFEWHLADSSVDIDQLPDEFDKDLVRRCRDALEQNEELKEFTATYREPMSVKRFFKNIKFSLTDGRSFVMNPDPAHYGF